MRAAAMPSTLLELVTRVIDDMCATTTHKSADTASSELTIPCQFAMSAVSTLSECKLPTGRGVVTRASGNVPVAAIRQVADEEEEVPIESAFQLRFLQALAASTQYNCAICHEISRVLPAPSGGFERGMDFFVNGKGGPQWGIRLHVNASVRGKDSAFNPDGQYATLGASDWMVVDIHLDTKSGKK